MRRRTLISGTCLLAATRVAAQVPGRIGYLHPRSISPSSPTLTILRPTWQRLGYVEGETFLTRSAESDLTRLPALAAELARLGAGVLIAVGPAAVRAATQAVPTTPIVAIDLETDPVRSGLAVSIGWPGGNVTGLFVDQPSLSGKWIGLLREADPRIRRVAIVWDPSTTRDHLEAALDAARGTGVTTTVIEARGADQFESAFRALGPEPATGVVQIGSPGFAVVAEAFAAAALRHRLPTISFLRNYAVAGLLMTYGPVQEIYFPRSVLLADRILRGARAGDIPIEGPDRFELTINLRTARGLGLALPRGLILLADEVIE